MLAGVLLLGCSASSQAKPTASSKMQLGELLFFNGNIDGAINAFRQAIVLDPKMWEAHLNLVNMYIQKSEFTQAIEECREVLKIKPGNKDVHLVLGNLLRAQNDLDGAEEELKKALDSGAEPAMTHNALGLTMLQKGNADGAYEHISKALQIKKNFPDAHLTLGVVHFKRGDKESALKEFDLAIAQKKEKYPEAHNAKADILANDGKWKEAIEEYNKAIKEEPKYAQAYASLGNAYFQLNELSKAKEAYEKAREINPSDKNILYGLALMLEKTGDISGAIAEFQNAVMLETDLNMATQIRLHINQLKDQGRYQFSVGDSKDGGNALPGLYNSNPFGGQTFADMIKIKPPKVTSKSK